MSRLPDSPRVRDEINKRLTINWLIQGAAVHAGRTIHHLVREELEACSPALPGLYDRFGVAMQLQYWRGEFALHTAIGRLFRTIFRRSHDPVPGHVLSARYSAELAEAARVRTLDRAKEKRVTRWPVLFSFYILYLLHRLNWAERQRAPALQQLARKAAAMAFDIPIDRLDAKLVQRFQLDRSRFPAPTTVLGAIFSMGIVSWNDIKMRDGTPIVRAQAINGLLLTAELVKGTAELICMHGLSGLDDETYAQVIRHADRIEHEPWMIKTGGEVWRRLLVALPTGVSIAEVLMNLSQLPPAELESLVEAIIQQSPEATRRLAALAERE